jgi:hypothetical protein
MIQIAYGREKRIVKMNNYFFLLLLSLSMPAAIAQNMGSRLSPYTSLAATPPPGQGIHPAPVISADTMPPPAVPTGSSPEYSGSTFHTIPERLPIIINLRTDAYSHNTHQYLGKRVVLTFRTNALNAMQMDLINVILQLDANSDLVKGKHNISVDVNEEQLLQIQEVLVPPAHHGQSQRMWLFHYLPVVRKFGCWVIGLGVVFATVMVSLAAYGVIMSHRGSADRVISTVAGLMILFMAYTIYCLLASNASEHHSDNQTIQSGPLQ